ncbi:MarR family winged helix-turn-helix transcriptional regulator [Propionispora hippei]|uniref:DNA-binding transcriptional regulator, MarR family n=1 Tax=Propionispora hippei DSM 15287 TaxID=1123003 RepID=A0A1M6IKF4_9FIRM|nr:MarR family transcriptional regulator [Propionispora hippei]SHJ34857.1 DNA-binding transcriptional regulator, MarR family [Propionispora hippei DSM 15287]
MDYRQTAETLFHLIPLLERNFVRPVMQQSSIPLSPAQMRVLVRLSDRKGITMTSLAKELVMSKQQMTPIVDKLVAENLVKREPDMEDRRIIHIVLTVAGYEMREKCKVETLAILQEKLSCLNDKDLTVLYTALTDLYAVIHKIP